MTLLVRIPPISAEGIDIARDRVKEVLDSGANGVVISHIRNIEEAKAAIGIFDALGVNVWSLNNKSGSIVVMLMVEDAEALAVAEEIASLPGYSALSCGIGSLAQALGDRDATEAGCTRVLRFAKNAGLPSIMIATTDTVVSRISEGYLGLLTYGNNTEDTIGIGRRAAGR